jgi:hypothetical protein
MFITEIALVYGINGEVKDERKNSKYGHQYPFFHLVLYARMKSIDQDEAQ